MYENVEVPGVEMVDGSRRNINDGVEVRRLKEVVATDAVTPNFLRYVAL